MKRKLISILIAVMLLGSLMTIPVQAADPDDIEASIVKGLEWLAAQQQPDGSWSPGYEPVALTGFALVKLADRAYETGYSPFDPDYVYSENVTNGLDYLFRHAESTTVGICFELGSYSENYSTGIAMMAIAATRAPDAIVPSGPYARETFKYVLQGNVDYMAWSQCDAPAPQQGGWGYGGNESWADQSNTGYSVLGLRYAEADLYGFKCDIPPAVKTELDFWINYIQRPDGGSDYDGTWNQSNLLRTGNLLFEMSFVDGPVITPRAQNAINYIQNNWPAGDLQDMYCLMKGFQSLDIETIIVGGNPIDWFDEMSTVIVDNQEDDGSWVWGGWGTALNTVFALLTLEKVSPPPSVNVEVDVPDCACDITGYDVNVTYTVERIPSTGTVEVYKDGVLYDTIILTDFSGTESKLYNIASDTPGMHTWKAVIDVTTGAGAQAHAEDDDIINVCETPEVLNIPDQTAPFETFALDDYLSYGGALPVSWSVSGIPVDWTVEIDAENGVTVTAPEGAMDPAILTFTASVTCPCGVICSDSDDAVFIPNQPPDCSEAYADLGCLWPPNHKFVDVSVMGVTDPDGDPVTITITAITSDEATATDEGSGGAKHAPDADGVGTHTASVRAERSGNGDGRVYVIHFVASDGRGGGCSGSVIVKVPHDQSVKDCPAIDSGQNYDATQIN